MKRIITIVSLSLILVLILTTVTLSLTKTNYKPSFDTPNAVIVYRKGAPSKTVSSSGDAKEKEAYNELVKLIDDAFRESTISGLFNGRLKDNISVEYLESGYVPSYTSTSESFIKLRYDTTKNVMLKGEVYAEGNIRPTYENLIIKLSATDSFTNIRIYIENNPLTKRCDYYYSATANLSAINSYVNEMTIPSI